MRTCEVTNKAAAGAIGHRSGVPWRRLEAVWRQSHSAMYYRSLPPRRKLRARGSAVACALDVIVQLSQLAQSRFVAAEGRPMLADALTRSLGVLQSTQRTKTKGVSSP